MPLRQLGIYLDRAVFCGAFTGPADVANVEIDRYLVLVSVSDAVPPDVRARLPEDLVALRPLGVFFTGVAAEQLFDRVLHVLATPSAPPVMTGYSAEPLDEAVEMFLLGTLPREEAWDRWLGYVLLSVGAEPDLVEQAATPRLHG